MDEFVAMLERASATVPDDLVDRVVARAMLDRGASGRGSGADPVTVKVGVNGTNRGHRRRWVLLAAAIALAAMLAGLVVVHRWRQDQPASPVRVFNPGRLPARVGIGDTSFTLTWVPPGFVATSATARSVTLSAPGWPDIVVSATPGEFEIVKPTIDLGPLAQAHFDDAAGKLQWNLNEWRLTIDATSPVRAALLGRLAEGIVPAVALQTPVIADDPVVIPDVRGLDYRDAAQRLAAAGFAVRLGISSTSGAATGTVEAVTPSGGTTTHRGSIVELGVVGLAGRTPPEDVLVSGDLPDAVGYAQFLRQPIGDGFYGSNEPTPIVFLHGELMGYGVGPSFEPLSRAAAGTLPAPESPPVTTSSPTTTSVTPGGP